MSEQIRKFLFEEIGLSNEQFDEALENSKDNNTTLFREIERLEVIDKAKLLEIFSNYYKTPKVYLEEMDIPKNITELLSGEIVVKYNVVPIDRVGNNIIVAIEDPRNFQTLDAIRFNSGYFAKPVLALYSDLKSAIEKYYADINVSQIKISSTATAKAKSNNKKKASDRQVIDPNDKENGPIIKLVNDILLQCLYRGASDIHIEPYEEFLRVRLRVDGSLQEIVRPPADMQSSLISRIKIMAGLNIAETRVPQDGAINILVENKPLDFRVNTVPASSGEKIVLRILDKSNLQVDMTQLGFEVDQLNGFKQAISNPFGMVLVTGPTGSGKTTTLYSALTELNKVDVNVMTAEDPVEYNLPGINQVQMKSDIGFTFASALRSFLRQDPDIIMVGEIRDLETAEIAIKASLTGHMVISTLHTNSAADTVSRLLNMGIAPFNLTSSLACVTAQRLMKKICDKCREVDPEITPEILINAGIPKAYSTKFQAMRGKGCRACANTGNKGRIAVHEVMVLNDQLKRAILNEASAIDIKKVAMKSGMKSMRQSALTKLSKGIVNFSEVIKATSADSSSA